MRSGELRTEVDSLTGAHVQSAPQPFTLAGAPGLEVVCTVTAPDAVTGKRVKLVGDHHDLRAGRRAVVDLGTPKW